jgi:hypothetical protein
MSTSKSKQNQPTVRAGKNSCENIEKVNVITLEKKETYTFRNRVDILRFNVECNCNIDIVSEIGLQINIYNERVSLRH